MKTLVIIDMQDSFLSEDDSKPLEIKNLKENVLILIEDFISKNLPIIVLEYDCMGQTTKKLNDVLNKYKYVYRAIKNKCDGSEEIISLISMFDLPSVFNICGIYSDQCVHATIEGLIESDLNLRIEIYEDCVWPFNPEYHDFYIDRLGSLRAESVCV